MKLHVFGSGTAIPHPERGASGYALVAADGTACLIECGPGSTRRWPGAGVTFRSARAIFVTHLHVDHCCDLPAVLFGRALSLPDTPLALLGPVGYGAHIEGIRALHAPWLSEGQELVEVVEMGDGDRATVGPFELETRCVLHPGAALGVRVRAGGVTFAFSGDSGPCEALVELSRGADLVMLECSYPAERVTRRHLNTQTAARVATDAGVERLVLTHFSAMCDGVDIEAEVRAAGYTGWLQLARDGDSIDVAGST